MKRVIAASVLVGFVGVSIVAVAAVNVSPVVNGASENIVAVDDGSVIENSASENILTVDEHSLTEISGQGNIVVVDDGSVNEIPDQENIEEPEEHFVIDFTDEEFDLLCVVVEAEAGGCSEQCRLWVADVIINRARECGSLTDAIYAPKQFTCVWDGGIRRHSVPSESTVRICKQELREVGYPGLWYFRSGHYHKGLGTPWGNIDNVYFSTR